MILKENLNAIRREAVRKRRDKLRAKEIISQYHQIEYQSTMKDKGWYKLSDMFPFVFSVEEEPQKVVLDTGGKCGSFEHAKIENGKLYFQDFSSQEWKKITNIRIIQGAAQPANTMGIMAVG